MCFFRMQPQITAHQICFWSDQLEQHHLYPPRFTIVVSGERAIDNTHAEILFKGIIDSAQDEIPLIVPHQSQRGEDAPPPPPPPPPISVGISVLANQSALCPLGFECALCGLV